MAAANGLGRADIPYSPTGHGSEARDSLGLTNYARALAQFVSNCQTPMTVGIQGEWGSGKTSLMNMVRNQLLPSDPSEASRTPIRLYTFETWQYGAIGSDELLGLRLMSSVVSKIISEADEKNGVLARAASRVRGATAGVMKAFAAGVVNKATMDMIDGGTLIGSLDAWSGPSSSVTELEQLKNDFRSVIEEVVRPSKRGGGRVVVMVDDLDRIRPGSAIELLEVLKNFMDVPGCVFIVACDYEVVRLGVKEKLGIEDEVKVRAFFDKIIQVPFQMPVAAYRIEGLLTDFVNERLPMKSTPSPLDDKGEVADMIARATGTNPRAFKRFLNSLDLLACLEESTEVVGSPPGPVSGAKKPSNSVWASKESALGLMALVALQVRWPHVASYLAANCTQVHDLKLALHTLRGFSDDDPGERTTDDALRDFLRARYPVDAHTVGEHPEVSALFAFVHALCKLLDTNGNEQLEDKELEPLARWVSKLALTGVDKTSASRGGWQEFVDTMSAGRAGGVPDAISLLEDLYSHREKLELVDLVRQSNYFRALVTHGGSKLSVFTINPQLKLIVSGKSSDRYMLTDMEDAARDFVATTGALGLTWKSTPRGWNSELSELAASARFYELASPVKQLLDRIDASARAASVASPPAAQSVHPTAIGAEPSLVAQ